MKLKKITLLPLILLLLIGCSKDDENEEVLCSNDLNYDRCCLAGEHNASPNESLTFIYFFARTNATVEWEIIDGEATVIDVETSNSNGRTKSIATIQFNTDFTMARFGATASHEIDEERCTSFYNIINPN